jgi:hypothetical protein
MVLVVSEGEAMSNNLVLLIGSPRSGSTMLQRMLGSHSQIFTRPEPHMLTPLAYLGYHDTVEKAPFDHINAAAAIREFVSALPRGEEDYLDALRAYTDVMYSRILEGREERFFMDKTPAYGLVLPFVTRLLPEAKYVVLTRHPLAILSSYANSFFEGDYRAAYAFNPIVHRYVPAIGTMIREEPVPFVQVRYEDVVANPAEELGRICDHLEIPFEEAAINYGSHKHEKGSFGDPKVEDHDRPVTKSKERWAEELKADPAKLEMARQIIGELDPVDLEAWGYPLDTIFEPLDRAMGEQPPAPGLRWKLNPYRLQRKVLLTLRKDIHTSHTGRMVRKVRYYCDVLLRD